MPHSSRKSRSKSASRLGRGILADPEKRVQPTRDPNMGAIRTFLGGPMGRFARVGTQPYWTPLAVMVSIVSFFLALGFLTKANCLFGHYVDDTLSLDWGGKRQYVSACYTDIIPLYKGRGIDQASNPFAYSWEQGDLTRHNEYPALAVMFMWVMGRITTVVYPLLFMVNDHLLEGTVYFIVTAIVCAIMWLVVVRWVITLAGNRPWDAMLVAASPVIVVHAFTNWDIPPAFLAVAAMFAVSRKKIWLGGVLIGLGTAFKLWPLYLLGAYLVLAFRSKRFGAWFKMAGAAIATWLVINVPVMVAYPETWREFLRLNNERPVDWITIYSVGIRHFGWSAFDNGQTPPTVLNNVTLGLFIVSCLAIAILGVLVKRTPRVAELAFLIVVAFLMFNKVWSPQYSLWLIPLVALAIPNWKWVFTWGISEMILWPILTWTMLGTDNKGLDGRFLDYFIVARDVFVLILVWMVIAQMLGKREDPVYRDNEGIDPLTGPFAVKPQACGDSDRPEQRSQDGDMVSATVDEASGESAK